MLRKVFREFSSTQAKPYVPARTQKPKKLNKPLNLIQTIELDEPENDDIAIEPLMAFLQDGPGIISRQEEKIAIARKPVKSHLQKHSLLQNTTHSHQIISTTRKNQSGRTSQELNTILACPASRK